MRKENRQKCLLVLGDDRGESQEMSKMPFSRKLEKIKDLQCERLPMRWSCLTNQYERFGTETGFTTTIQSLQPHGKELRRRLCEPQLQRDDGLPIIFPGESRVVQDTNKGGVWRCKGEFLPDATDEQAQHPIAIMGWGAIRLEFRSVFLRCPDHFDAEGYMKMLADACIFGRLIVQYSP
jgi:hypothetical protein